ncbi:2,3-dihydro-2,3-dihydroxybenzoate dehydrogenase [Longimycelium tulufanense]|uniref:2,3-dihydro-2,3-dihydroxybenzoate dehydrogenase n=1 Tax=Longimycelium tulufanense TaxID=907463 RepID=A0A8J3CCW6_9PSEU|nr:2,3-dihydro-2,3-dihydroxybenzoate dehydrogenase [Longimycelium tulufanense]GGM49019.1 2,3-dihydro-2,3-dihydroxybenzoate dehydrogenase [Longimycelium tulufanense]
MSVPERITVVTGAAGGIGSAVARRLCLEDHTVVAVDSSGATLERLQHELGESGHRLIAYLVDATDSSAVEEVIDRTEREVGPVEHLVNVAGVLRPGSTVELDDAAWRDTFAVNTDAVFYFSRSVATRLLRRNRGSIVTVASNASRVPRTMMSAYAASKAAAAMFTRCLGLELARHGIRCNVVSPGSTDTPMLDLLGSSAQDRRPAIGGDPDSFRVGIPLGRIASPNDIADVVHFLLSDRARHITMENICVDGGAALGC